MFRCISAVDNGVRVTKNVCTILFMSNFLLTGLLEGTSSTVEQPCIPSLLLNHDDFTLRPWARSPGE